MITVVSGLPCSGSSLVMNMLRAGGMAVLADQREDASDTMFDRTLDWSKFEYLSRFPETIDRAIGKAVKLYSMYLYNLPTERTYRVLYINRDLQEIADAGQAVAEEGSEGDFLRLTQKAYLLGAHRKRVKSWMNSRGDIETLNLNFADIVSDPYLQSLKIRNFLDRELDIESMSEIIRPQVKFEQEEAVSQQAAIPA